MVKKLLINLWYYLFPINRMRKSGAQIGENIFWGEHSYIELENAKYLQIEDNVVVSAFNKFILHDSSLNNCADFDVIYGKIILKKKCYIGANCTILSPTVIGDNTIIGAGSLVKGQIKANSVYAGNPAKYICSVEDLEKKWTKRKKNNYQKNLIKYQTKISPYK